MILNIGPVQMMVVIVALVMESALANPITNLLGIPKMIIEAKNEVDPSLNLASSSHALMNLFEANSQPSDLSKTESALNTELYQSNYYHTGYTFKYASLNG